MENTQTIAYGSVSVPRLDALIAEKANAEIILDFATSQVDDFRQSKTDDSLIQDSEFAHLLELEKSASNEWHRSYNAILNFIPTSHRETSAAILALLDLLSEGHDSEPLEKEMRRLALNLEKCG
jgi:hypothetical protein